MRLVGLGSVTGPTREAVGAGTGRSPVATFVH